MRELCQTHKLAIATDGKCVLCRRPSLRLFAVREEHEHVISRVFTVLLGVGLAAAGSALIYVSTLDAGYTGGRYIAAPAPLGKLPLERAKKPVAPAQLDAGAPASADPNRAALADTLPKQAKARAAAEARRSAAPLPKVAVAMYATPWCEICDRAREFLLARDVELTEYDIDNDRAAERRLAKLNPNASVPTFEIAGRAYVGFNAWDLEDAIRASARSIETASAGAAKTRAP